jgi:hypothetical protein
LDDIRVPAVYLGLLYRYTALILTYGGGAWVPGTTFSAPQQIPLLGGTYTAIVDPTNNGAILYTVVSKTPFGVPILPILPYPDTISEEEIAQKEKLVANEQEAEAQEAEATDF